MAANYIWINPARCRGQSIYLQVFDTRAGQSHHCCMLNTQQFSRRQTLALLGGAASSLALAGPLQARSAAPKIMNAHIQALLDQVAWRMIELAPESATSLGIDTGPHAALRSQLSDRSKAGQDKIADLIDRAQKDAQKMFPFPAIDGRDLDAATRTSLDVVKSAFTAALEGFDLPYGDVALGGWRNTPYVVIQNVGAYLDTPRFLDSDHPVDNASDAEAYLARLSEFPAQLDGELGRIRDARGKTKRSGRWS